MMNKKKPQKEVILKFDAEYLRKVRKDKLKMTREEFAKAVGVAPLTITLWECGKVEPSNKSTTKLYMYLKNNELSKSIPIDKFYKKFQCEKAEKPDRFNGRILKRKRLDAGLSQFELAEMMNVNPFTVSKWELGTTSCSKTNAEKLASIFYCKAEEFYKNDSELEQD